MGYEKIFSDKFAQVQASQNAKALAYMYFCLHDPENTLFWLKKAVEEHPAYLSVLLSLDYESLLKDRPEFRALARKANLEQFLYSRERISSFDMGI
jgi:hypothetical protein